MDYLLRLTQTFDWELTNNVYNPCYGALWFWPVVPGQCGLCRASDILQDNARVWCFDHVNGPTPAPTNQPTGEPTQRPTDRPTDRPTERPTGQPTPAPTNQPTDASTRAPSDVPTFSPAGNRTPGPTRAPTHGVILWTVVVAIHNKVYGLSRLC